jgi:hypothetical protein
LRNDAGLAHLRSLTALTSINISDDGLAHLGGLKAMQSHDVRGTCVSDAGLLLHLSGLRALKNIGVSGPDISEAGATYHNLASTPPGHDIGERRLVLAEVHLPELVLPPHVWQSGGMEMRALH